MQASQLSFGPGALLSADDAERFSGRAPGAGPTALVVSGNVPDALTTVSFLTERQFHVTMADTFADAKARLIARPPSLLVTELRLGEYNGLELVLRGKTRRPTLAALVIAAQEDAVLQSDAELMGATFVLTPVSPRELQAAIFRTLFEATPPASPSIRAPFERREHDRRRHSEPAVHERRLGERRQHLLSLIVTHLIATH